MASTARKSAAKTPIKHNVAAPAAPASTAQPVVTAQDAAPASDAKPVSTRRVETAPASPVRKSATTAKSAKAAKTASKAGSAKPVKASRSATGAKTPRVANPVKEEKAKKPKLVRDSFTIPKPEYLVLEQLKQRATQLGAPIKKSELLRAGIKALAAMDSVDYLASLAAVPAIKTGRPAKS